MNIKNGIFLWLATLAALAFGLLLPDIVYQVQSKSAAASPQQYTVDTIQLEMSKSAPVSDKMRLLSAKNETMNLDNGNKLTKETAYQLALAFLTYMKEYGIVLDPQAYSSNTTKPVLTFTQDSKNAAVIWECGLINPDDGSLIVIRLDDETGKMLSFLYCGHEIFIQHGDAAAILSTDDWGKMCAEYYGFKSVGVKRMTQESVERKYDLVFTDDDGNELIVPYRVDPIPSSSDRDAAKINMNFNFK